MLTGIALTYVLVIVFILDVALYAIYWAKYAMKFGYINYFPGSGFYVAWKANKGDKDFWDF